MDNHTAEQRHRNMSAVRSKNTKPEILVRKYLFANGFRYRINDKKLAGKPDIVLPKYKTVIFINGCFWHGHKDCKDSHIPKTNTDFWTEKINKNKVRDAKNYELLQNAGWKVIILWTCELKSKTKEQTLTNLAVNIKSNFS